MEVAAASAVELAAASTAEKRAEKKIKFDMSTGATATATATGDKESSESESDDDDPYLAARYKKQTEGNVFGIEENCYFQGIRRLSKEELNLPRIVKDMEESCDHAINYYNNGKSEDQKVEFDELVKANYVWSGYFLFLYITFKVKGSSKLSETLQAELSETLQAEVRINMLLSGKEDNRQAYKVELCRRKP